MRGLCLLFLVLLPLSSSVKISHVVVLMEENRSFDHMFGWYPGVDGLTGNEYNLVNTSDPNSKRVYVMKTQPDISPCDPDHGTPATTSKVFGQAALKKNDTSNATMSGFVEWENKIGHESTDYCEVMNMLTPDHIPVLSYLASEYAIMDRFFAAFPGPTWPNRLFMLSATSAGLSETGSWYHQKVGTLFPQETIFDQIMDEGLTWRNYFNDTPWELFLGAIANNPENLAPLDQFYEDARTGNLPNFSWINPRSGINMTLMQGSNDDHPDHDIALGEAYYKDIYEALRASPQWNETLFVITFDEHGGFYDHVPTPLNVPPPGDGEESYPDKGVAFDRLGIRIPTLLISPWIPKGAVISGPPEEQKPFPNSEYTLTSIMATARKLLGMTSGPLTKRDAWSATFEQVLNLTSPRTDCPIHLPSPPPPAPSHSAHAEAHTPINGLQWDILNMHAGIMGIEIPKEEVFLQKHVSEWAQKIFGQHSALTAQWKMSKASANYSVVIRPVVSSGWVNDSWVVTQSSNVSFNTIYSKLHDGTLVCLDYEANPVVGISTCYPSPRPEINRDTYQQWVWGKDATVHPVADLSLCLTTKIWSGDDTLYVKPCVVDDVEQHFAYHGAAPGNDYSGSIYFGDDTNCVGIVSSV